MEFFNSSKDNNFSSLNINLNFDFPVYILTVEVENGALLCDVMENDPWKSWKVILGSHGKSWQIFWEKCRNHITYTNLCGLHCRDDDDDGSRGGKPAEELSSVLMDVFRVVASAHGMLGMISTCSYEFTLMHGPEKS